MKIIVKTIFVLSVTFVVLGYILESYSDMKGKLLIGLGVVAFAFVFMPLFIYQRYKNRIGAFIDERMQTPEDVKKE